MQGLGLGLHTEVCKTIHHSDCFVCGLCSLTLDASISFWMDWQVEVKLLFYRLFIILIFMFQKLLIKSHLGSTIMSKECITHLSLTTSVPVRCARVNKVDQWNWVTISPFHVISHNSHLQCVHLFPLLNFLLGHILLVLWASPDLIFPLTRAACKLLIVVLVPEPFPVGRVSQFGSSNGPLSLEQRFPSVPSVHACTENSSLKKRRLHLTWCCFWSKHYYFWPAGHFLPHLKELNF